MTEEGTHPLQGRHWEGEKAEASDMWRQVSTQVSDIRALGKNKSHWEFPRGPYSLFMVARTNYHKVKHILITPQFWRSEVFLSYRQGVGRAVFPLESQGILRWESIPHLFQFLGIPAFVVISMSAWSLLLCKLTYSQVLRIRMWASLGPLFRQSQRISQSTVDWVDSHPI